MKKFSVCLLFIFLTTFTNADDLTASLSPELLAINAELPQLLEKAVNEAGHNLTIINQPAGRSIEHFRNGEHDIELRIPTFAQQNDFVTAIQVPVSQLTIKAFYSNDLTVSTIMDLKGKKLASIHGLALNEVIIAKIPELQLNQLRDYNAVAKYVAASRADFFIQEEFAGIQLLKDTQTANEITMLEESLLEIPLFVFVHNNKTDIISDLQPVLEQMVNDGEFK